jgi:hypothetical protein
MMEMPGLHSIHARQQCRQFRDDGRQGVCELGRATISGMVER